MANKMRVPSVSGNYPAVDSDGLETGEDERVFVVVTRAFDGHGNQLVRPDNDGFDDFPGVELWVETPDGVAGTVTLSPIHGDSRRAGRTDIAPGTPCVVRGAKGAPPLQREDDCACGNGTYLRIFLSPQLEKGETVLICNVWGCHRSRIIDNSELLSWVDY